MTSSVDSQIAISRLAALVQAKKWRSAIALASEQLTAHTGNTEIMRLAAVAFARSGNVRQAVELLYKALELAPGRAVLHLNLGSCQREIGEVDLAVASYRKALQLQPDLLQGWFNLGRLFLLQADAEAAITCLQRAVALDQRHCPSWMCLGHACKASGDLQASAEAYRQVLSIEPENGQAWWALLNIKTVKLSDTEFNQLQSAARRTTDDDDHFIPIQFALGMAYESRSDFENAFAGFAKGNSAQRKKLQYDAKSKQRLGERICKVFDADLLERLRDAGEQSSAPIFIVSLPRSGSTLVEQILSSHPDVNGASELPDLGQLALQAMAAEETTGWAPEKVRLLDKGDLRAVGKSYIERTARWSQGYRHFTDKMPNNFPLVGFIALILPNARVIHCSRDRLDVGLSCFRQLFASGHHWSYDLADIAGHIRYHDRVCRHWKSLLPGRFLQVSYEDLLANQEEVTRSMLEFCGLSWHDDCLRFFENRRQVRTASAGQVRQPLYQTAAGRWRSYEKFIKELIESLA